MAIDKIDNKIIDEMNETVNKYKGIKKVTHEVDGDVILFHVDNGEDKATFSFTRSEIRDILACI